MNQRIVDFENNSDSSLTMLIKAICVMQFPTKLVEQSYSSEQSEYPFEQVNKNVNYQFYKILPYFSLDLLEALPYRCEMF